MNVPSLSVIPRTFYVLLERIFGGGSYVKSGLNPTATGPGSLFVSVAAGDGVVNNVAFSFIGGTVLPDPADSNPRYDLVRVASGASSPSVVKGTPSNAPIAPALPANDLMLGLVYIPASAIDYTTGGFVADYTMPWLAHKLTTKGDLLTFSTIPVRRAVGADGTYVRANSANADGLEYGVHDSTGDPHTQYATDGDLSGHAGAGDPHPAYSLDTDLTTHAGGADPHTGYRLESADHPHTSAGLNAGQLDHGLALTGLTDDDHTQYRLESADHPHTSSGANAGQLDHGTALTGLTDDDHTQYRLESADHPHTSTGLNAGQLDHGSALTGLSDDDHPQYATNTEFDDHSARHEPGGADALAALADHNARHEPGGADPMAVDAAAATGSLRTLGTGAAQAAVGSHTHGGITLVAEQATTSGTSIDFTGIPAGVKRITIMFNGVSTNGTSTPMVQLGDAGGIETTGYAGTHGSAATDQAWSGAGITISNTWSAAGAAHGQLVLSLQDASDNTWVAAGLVTSASTLGRTGGAKALSATLDRIRLTTVNGTDTFDAGSVSISYE